MKYEYKYVVCIFDNNKNSLSSLENLLKDGWEPVRETGMPSSGSNYSENAQSPICLCVLKREISN